MLLALAQLGLDSLWCVMSVPQISTEGRPSTSAATLVNSAMRN
jgi:hypothetical protein